VAERIPFATGTVSASYVLNDDDVSELGGVVTEIYLVVFVFIVGSALQQYSKAAGDRWTIDIGKQHHAVAHAHGYPALDCNRFLLRPSA
jgi:hypothetical protein